jgi:uncharacterized protein (DUF1800 family)
MLIWLDADSNRKGHPNENLARELLELFTLGIGNYGESDVKEAARALTGWTIVGGQFGVRPERHDEGEKSILGQRGKFDGDQLLGLLVEHPATAKRIAWRICHTFMGEEVVDPPALLELADGLASRRLDVGWAVETILHSERFFSYANLRTRVLGPAEYIVGALRAFELCDPPPSTLLLADWSGRMGQDLFYPPNVGGWNEGRQWLGSRAILARANFAAALAEGRLWRLVGRPEFGELLLRHGQDGNLNERVAWLATLLWGESPPGVVQAVVAGAGAMKNENRLANAAAQLLARPEHYLA